EEEEEEEEEEERNKFSYKIRNEIRDLLSEISNSCGASAWVALKQKYSERIENQKTQLKSCCLVSFEQKKRVNADKLVESIKDALNTHEFESILLVGQFRWSIHFNDNDKFVSATNQKLKFDNNMYQLIPANEFDKKNKKNTENNELIITAFYRIHWLPLDVPLHNAVQDFAGLHKISNCKAFVQLCGMPPKCLGCKRFGHIRKECSKCSSCKNFGHNSREFSFANRTRVMPKQSENDQEDIVGEDEMQFTESTDPLATTVVTPCNLSNVLRDEGDSEYLSDLELTDPSAHRGSVFSLLNHLTTEYFKMQPTV
ncbi:hypothetical protein BpHYR1_048340, partial [Brachionus plicatilis]